MSEQQEQFEPRWDRDDDRRPPRRGVEAGGPQYVGPDDGGDFVDHEATAVAGEVGADYLRGPEDSAMHVEDEDGRPIE